MPEQNTVEIAVICDICGNRETDTKEMLESFGWELCPSHEFCPNCNAY